MNHRHLSKVNRLLNTNNSISNNKTSRTYEGLSYGGFEADKFYKLNVSVLE